MKIAVSLAGHELEMAHRWMDWVIELGGTDNHSLLLIPASGVDIKNIIPKAEKAFGGRVTIIVDYEGQTSDWQITEPMRSASGPNSSFRQVAWHCYMNKVGPFFWCELDCIPLKKDWLDRLEAEHKIGLAEGKPFTGGRVELESVPVHMTGNAVYLNVPEQAPTLVQRTNWTPKGQDKSFELAFDIAGANEAVPKAHFTNLIQHKFRYEGFKSRKQFDEVINPNAVVFHSDKLGTIFPYLRQNLSGGVESRHAAGAVRGSQCETDLQDCPTITNHSGSSAPPAQKPHEIKGLEGRTITDDQGQPIEGRLVNITASQPIKKQVNGIWVLEGEQTEKDPNLLPLILDYINYGDTVIDAGAWIGGHTMAYLRKVGDKGAVHAFEPNLAAWGCLIANAPQARVHRVALGDRSYTASLSGEKGKYDSAYIGEDQKIAEVKMVCLDDYGLAPNFIKIDVEGCELKVLKGAVNTIEKYHPKMVIEINVEALKRQGNTPEEVKGWLREKGYSFELILDFNANPSIYNIIATVPADEIPERYQNVEVVTRTSYGGILERAVDEPSGLPPISEPWQNRKDSETEVRMLCSALALFCKTGVYKGRVRQALREAKIIK